ncbi:outer membrane beta-barrel protein [Bergeyella zoohelcum]|uniref:Outer membrane protein beta-barrel domain-containing protein n=3 Tax=Bergeyella zoohelcum TaxID=1015 RepID=A0A7Z8YLA3_9FLAO|nr:outer membrane beta-barrel protein [Bergeyella zoohelcum]VDH02656.1 Uncharacterised protein [Bergeyella zoohelcum]
MKYLLVFFIVGVVPVFGQKYFVEGGGVYSTLKVSSNFTDTQLVSDKKKGYFIAFGNKYILNRQWSAEAKIKLSETGGKVSNSTFFIKNQLPYDLEKYRNADIRLAIYQLGAEINALYHYSSLAFYAGIQPSVIFFVSYKERNVKKKQNNGGNSISMEESVVGNDDKKINILSVKGQIGSMYSFTPKWYLQLGYHFNITNMVTVLLNNNWRFSFNETVYQLGVGYRF